VFSCSPLLPFKFCAGKGAETKDRNGGERETCPWTTRLQSNAVRTKNESTKKKISCVVPS
jgi:hypothetical protein